MKGRRTVPVILGSLAVIFANHLWSTYGFREIFSEDEGAAIMLAINACVIAVGMTLIDIGRETIRLRLAAIERSLEITSPQERRPRGGA